MTKYSTKERLIASLLSYTPKLKQIVKSAYININALVYRKRYKSRLLFSGLSDIEIINFNDEETFFGYYDKSPLNGEWVIFHKASFSTKQLPDPRFFLKIMIANLRTKETIVVGDSSSYTWQQGARTQWISSDLLMYNDFREGHYVSVVYSISQKKEIKQFDLPVQDGFGTDYFLSINYRRIMNLRPDYGYRNLPLMSDNEMEDLRNDGIWKINYESGGHILLHSLQDIIACGYKPFFDKCQHKINHVMISPDGKGFIFIHRFYLEARRFDRLMYSDFRSLRVLSDNEMVSHCCWMGIDTIFGYLRHNNINGFYNCSLTGEIVLCKEVTDLGVGDGHPSCWKDWIVFDTYPDKSRMQQLMLYNIRTRKIISLLEVYQSTQYKNQTRCDLHPRFSENGQLVFFDSVYSGKRKLCYVNVSEIVQ